MSGSQHNAWFRFCRPEPLARVRLFCLPFAGGGASIYRTWPGAMAPDIDVCPVQLPGREERLREPAFRQIEPLCHALLAVIRPLLDKPFALFGHSMGAIIVYELTRMLAAQGMMPPEHLFVSGQRAPHIPLGRPISYNLPPEGFHKRLRELNGTPEAVLRDPEMMDLISPLLRSDFELSETYQRERRSPLGCPVSAFGGIDDIEVSLADLEAWRLTTVGAFRLRRFPGDHFFLPTAAELMREIQNQLADIG
jgi:medium-chain acyl-[acyl-carrier-protein] hydrolase